MFRLVSQVACGAVESGGATCAGQHTRRGLNERSLSLHACVHVCVAYLPTAIEQLLCELVHLPRAVASRFCSRLSP